MSKPTTSSQGGTDAVRRTADRRAVKGARVRRLTAICTTLLGSSLLLPLIGATQTPAPTAAPTSAPTPAPSVSKDDKPPVNSKDTKKVETIEVKSAAEADDPRRDDTATKIVVNSAEINKFGDTQLADVLKRLPGITVQGNSIRMRGLGSGYTQILIDGERAPPGFSIDQLSPTAIERIEIVRAATAEFSTQSIAGTINIVLKRKVNLAQRELRAGYAKGSFFTSTNASFLVSDKVDRLSYTVNGYVYLSDSYYPYQTTEAGFDARGVPILNRYSEGRSDSKGRGGGIGPRLVWNLKGGDSLTWQSFVNINRGDGNGSFRFITITGTPPPSVSSLNAWRWQNDAANTNLNWITKLDGGAKLDVKFGLSYNLNENDFRGRSFNTQNQQNFDRTNNSRSTDDGVTFTGKYSTPAVEGHALVVGWDFGFNEREQTNRTRDVLFANVAPFIPPFNINEDSTAKVTRLAAFAQDEWNVTKQWSVYLGARWEGLTTTSEGNTYQSITNRSSVFSPIAQTLYKLQSRPGEQIRLALTRTYKAPSTGDLIPRLFTSVENKPTSPDARGNPDLKPELATGIDIAYEKFWGQGASMSLAANMRRITDYNRRGLLFINDRWVSLPVNDGKANTRSIEFDTKFPWQLFWKSAPPVDFRFNAARNWSSVDSVPGPNNRLAQQVPYNATLGMDYRMKNGVLVAGGSFTIRGGGLVRTSITQSTYLSTKRDLDMYALWKVTPKLQARLTLSNILKPAAVNENTYFDANGSTNTRTNTPSKMNIRAGIEWKF